MKRSGSCCIMGGLLDGIGSACMSSSQNRKDTRQIKRNNVAHTCILSGRGRLQALAGEMKDSPEDKGEKAGEREREMPGSQKGKWHTAYQMLGNIIRPATTTVTTAILRAWTVL